MRGKAFAARLFALVSAAVILCAGNVSAAQWVDPAKDCQLRLWFQDGDRKLAKVPVSLYQVAVSDEYAHLTLSEAFSAFDGTDVNAVTDGDRANAAAAELLSYVKEQKPAAVRSQEAGESGAALMQGLKPGLYLAVAESVKAGGYTYSFTPVLVQLPQVEDGEFSYAAELEPKFTKQKPPGGGGGGGGNPPKPNTPPETPVTPPTVPQSPGGGGDTPPGTLDGEGDEMLGTLRGAMLPRTGERGVFGY